MNETKGLYGCPLGCDEPPGPSHVHALPPILNARYYCPDATAETRMKHQWGLPSRWRKRVHCTRCGYRRPKAKRS